MFRSKLIIEGREYQVLEVFNSIDVPLGYDDLPNGNLPEMKVDVVAKKDNTSHLTNWVDDGSTFKDGSIIFINEGYQIELDFAKAYCVRQDGYFDKDKEVAFRLTTTKFKRNVVSFDGLLEL